MHWIYYALLIAVQCCGLALNLASLPGLWLMVASLALYAWVTGFDHHVGWTGIIVVAALALIAEIVEFVAGAAGSAQAGGTKRSMVGSVVGGVVGAIVLTPLIPIPVVGTLVGLCLGTFVGASATEYLIRTDPAHSVRVGIGAAKGRMWGVVIKMLFGVIMLIVSAGVALPV